MGSESGLTRRKLVGTAAAGAAGAALANAPGALGRLGPRHRHHKVDVAIVGAGFAGLTAAIELHRHGKSVVVLEARNRVGGRAHNHHLGHGKVSEAGATFVGPTQGHILALARRFGVGKFPTYDTGDNVYYRDGLRLTYSDQTPAGIVPPDPTIDADAAAVVTELDNLSTKVPVDAPWDASRAAQWDGQTLENWAETHSSYSTNESFRRLVAVATARSSAPSRGRSRCSSPSSISLPPATRLIRAPSSATSAPGHARPDAGRQAGVSRARLRRAERSDLRGDLRSLARVLAHERRLGASRRVLDS